ncbi:MAG TPA: DUF1819 domain-containing protein [Glutamicibacter sp.]|uniref:DUF1819 family protein n=1 Tax=Glutamicibacter arilaitensis TaxID=256701 RepID=UPI000EDC1C45|nr:DUF1819 family protein [Glutamicibacter arilaitensis]HCM95428.1 DUF1819 domain-containing protein [Glutamicibacter sp.]
MSRNTDDRYVLSFTTGGLLARESAILAPLYAELRDWAQVRDTAVEENLLQTRTRSTGIRRVRETVNRLSVLSNHELEILAELTATERGHVMWAAACRRFEFVGEFAEEVLRERFLTLAGTVSYGDFDSFYRSKAMWHAELDDVTDLSYKKLRQVLFRMMVEAGLLNTEGAIEPALLSARVIECLTKYSPSDVRFFPMRMV